MKVSFLNLALPAIVLLAGCGKSVGKMGTLGIQGIGANKECIPNTSTPFGETAPLSENERLQVYRLIKAVHDLGRIQVAAGSVAYDPKLQPPNELTAGLARETQEGKCEAKFGPEGTAVIVKLTGGSCSVSYEKTTTPQVMSAALQFVTTETALRLQTEPVGAEAVRSIQEKQEMLIKHHGAFSPTEMHMTGCFAMAGAFEMGDGSKIQTFFSRETFVDDAFSGDLKIVSNNHARKLMKLPNFAVEVEHTSKYTDGEYSLDTLTINGQPVIASEHESFGLSQSDVLAFFTN